MSYDKMIQWDCKVDSACVFYPGIAWKVEAIYSLNVPLPTKFGGN